MADKNTESTEVVEPKVKKERGPRIPRLERLQQEIEKAKADELARKEKAIVKAQADLDAAIVRRDKAEAKVQELNDILVGLTS